MYETLFNWKNKSYFEYDDFLKISKKMVAEIVFNEDKIHDDIFTYLSEVNTTEVLQIQTLRLIKLLKIILSKLSITTLIIQIQNL